MKKRVLAALLWFYAGWYAGAVIASFLGLHEALGPIIGTAAAGLFAGDPRGIIWKRPVAPAPQSSPAGSPGNSMVNAAP